MEGSWGSGQLCKSQVEIRLIEHVQKFRASTGVVELNKSSLSVLKVKLVDDTNCKCTEVRLMRPSLEIFLMVRGFLRVSSQPIFYLQLRPSTQDIEGYYINIEVDTRDYKEGQLVEFLAVGDLSLDPRQRWHLVEIDIQGNELILGSIYQDKIGIWQFNSVNLVPLEENKKISPDLFFIGGPVKSGTTWVQLLLNFHPDFVSIGENGLFSFPNSALLSAVMTASNLPYFATAVPKTAPFKMRSFMAYAGQAERILDQIANLSNAKGIADRNPSYQNYSSVILDALQQSRYIQLVRNPLDVIISRFYHEKNIYINSPSLSQLPDDSDLREHILNYDSATAAFGSMFSNTRLFDWALDQALVGFHQLSVLQNSKKTHIVFYEDLISDFADTALKLFNFCGLEVDDFFLEQARLRLSFSQLSGGRAPGNNDNSSFYRNGQSNAYPMHLTEDQINYAKKRILNQNSFYEKYFDSNVDTVSTVKCDLNLYKTDHSIEPSINSFDMNLLIDQFLSLKMKWPLIRTPNETLVYNESIKVPSVDNLSRIMGNAVYESIDYRKYFLQSGYNDLKSMLNIAEIYGFNVSIQSKVLDWGVGCARMARHIPVAVRNSFYGIDVDPVNIGWCKDNMPFGTYLTVKPFENTVFDRGYFDLIYSHSVLTHLSENDQDLWLRELSRISRGLMIFSVGGLYSNAQSSSWIRDPSLMEMWLKKGIVVSPKNNDDITDVCPPGYYRDVAHTPDYIKKHWSKFVDVIDILPGAFGNVHDAVVCRPIQP